MTTGQMYLVEFLKRSGYIVYPYELCCGFHGNPHYPFRFVDVAAFKNPHFYAFEYKSSTDSLSRAVKQIENYRNSFDYVVLLVEIPRKGRYGLSLTLKRGKRIYEIIRLGAGVWIFSKSQAIANYYTVKEIIRPRLQSPQTTNRQFIERQFRQYQWKDKRINAAFHSAQQNLEQWLTA